MYGLQGRVQSSGFRLQRLRLSSRFTGSKASFGGSGEPHKQANYEADWGHILFERRSEHTH